MIDQKQFLVTGVDGLAAGGVTRLVRARVKQDCL